MRERSTRSRPRFFLTLRALTVRTMGNQPPEPRLIQLYQLWQSDGTHVRSITDCFVFCRGWLYDEGEARREGARCLALLDRTLDSERRAHYYGIDISEQVNTVLDRFPALAVGRRSGGSAS